MSISITEAANTTGQILEDGTNADGFSLTVMVMVGRMACSHIARLFSEVVNI